MGDTDWAAAVSELAIKVHSEQGEFEEVVADAVSVLGQPCRDGGAKVSQWLHCLAVTRLLLERLSSLHQLNGWAIEPQEIVDALLLPAVSVHKRDTDNGGQTVPYSSPLSYICPHVLFPSVMKP